MRKLLGIGAFIAGFIGYSQIHMYLIMSLNYNIIVLVVIPLCALLSLCLGIVTWKQKEGVFSYATLLATAGIAGAVFGMTLFVLSD